VGKRKGKDRVGRTFEEGEEIKIGRSRRRRKRRKRSGSG